MSLSAGEIASADLSVVRGARWPGPPLLVYRLADLEALLGRPVDLVEAAPIRNPYFLEAIQRDKVLLFAA